MRTLILATVAAAMPFGIAAASAQESTAFTGPRVEGLIGWDRVQANGGHDDGVAYGVGVGYDVAVGKGLILGLEGELSDATTKECGTFASAVDRLCARTGRDLYVGGRLGVPVSPNVLLYGKVGYTNARYKLTYDDGVDGSTNFRDGKNYDGVRLGAGVEYAITPQAFVKAEYRYSNWEDGLSKNQVLGGFGFRF